MDVYENFEHFWPVDNKKEIDVTFNNEEYSPLRESINPSYWSDPWSYQFGSNWGAILAAIIIILILLVIAYFTRDCCPYITNGISIIIDLLFLGSILFIILLFFWLIILLLVVIFT